MNEKLKERIERLVEERDAIQSKIDNVNGELNRLYPLKNDLVDILSKKHNSLKELLDATIRELRYVIATESDEIKMTELNGSLDTTAFRMGVIHFTDEYGFRYSVVLESVHAKQIMKECDYGNLVGFVRESKEDERPEINGSHFSFDNMPKVGWEVNGMSVSLHRVEGKVYYKLKIEDRYGNYFCVLFSTPREDYAPVKLVLRDEDERALWISEIPKRVLNKSPHSLAD